MPVDIASAAEQMVSQMLTGAQTIGGQLAGDCSAIGKAIVGPILVAEMTFIGFRIMFKANVIEELTRLTRSCLILFIILYAQIPQKLIESVLPSLDQGGKQIAQKVNPAASGQPAAYWAKWIGSPEDENYKFSCNYILKTVWNDTDGKVAQSQLVGPGAWDILKNTAQNMWEKISSMLTSTKWQMMLALVMQSTMFFQLMLQLAAIAVGSYMLPLFTTIAILVSSRYAFYIVWALGLTVIPLILFGGDQFRNMWTQYLTYLVACALITPLYYIMSAIGYTFADTAFQALFVQNVPFFNYEHFPGSKWVDSSCGY
jgi:hypothetical protein